MLNEKYTPFIKRTSTLIGIAIISITIILLSFIIKGSKNSYNFISMGLAKEEVTVTITKFSTNRNICVDKWTAVRKYDKSSVPSNTWDIEEDTYWVCTRRDSNYLCISGHYETDYDYNVMSWKDFKCWDEVYIGQHPEFKNSTTTYNNPKKFQITEKISRTITVGDKYNNKEFLVNKFPNTRTIKVIRRKKSKKILNLKNN